MTYILAAFPLLLRSTHFRPERLENANETHTYLRMLFHYFVIVHAGSHEFQSPAFSIFSIYGTRELAGVCVRASDTFDILNQCF